MQYIIDQNAKERYENESIQCLIEGERNGDKTDTGEHGDTLMEEILCV